MGSQMLSISWCVCIFRNNPGLEKPFSMHIFQNPDQIFFCGLAALKVTVVQLGFHRTSRMFKCSFHVVYRLHGDQSCYITFYVGGKTFKLAWGLLTVCLHKPLNLAEGLNSFALTFSTLHLLFPAKPWQ